MCMSFFELLPLLLQVFVKKLGKGVWLLPRHNIIDARKSIPEGRLDPVVCVIVE
jgi:hypothetical protein